MTELAIVLLNAIAAGFAAYNFIYSGIRKLYEGKP